MFEKYDPRKGRQLQLINEHGRVKKAVKDFPMPSDTMLKKAWRYMLKTRTADNWAVSLQRQGRMPTYPPNLGQEANAVGALMAVRNDDWFVQSFRELGGLIVRGIPLEKLYLYYYGNEEGSLLERNKYYSLPVAVPIASQLPHAVGLAYAEKYRKTGRIALAFVGDGGTSQGDFHSALNFAASLNSPVIFYVQNNQFAISMGRSSQTASATIAEKAFAYGMEGIQIDGNDAAAVISAVSRSVEYCRSENRPLLIEAYTYRLGAHTTADDPKRYRSDDEVSEWRKKDPLKRLESYLSSAGLLTEQEIENEIELAANEAKLAFDKCETLAEPGLNDIFNHTFSELPSLLQEQKAILEGLG